MLIPLLFTGKTALHWAASVNSLEVTKELLRNGAKKDAQDEKVTQRLNMCFIEQNVAFKIFEKQIWVQPGEWFTQKKHFHDEFARKRFMRRLNVMSVCKVLTAKTDFNFRVPY